MISNREIVRTWHRLIMEGGPGSGNFGHSGRPGEVGGSGFGFTKVTSNEKVRLTASEGTFKKRLKNAKEGVKSWFDIVTKDRSYNYGNLNKKLNQKDADLVSNYVSLDKEPTGSTERALEKAISIVKPLDRDIVSYRGMRCDSKTFKEIKQGTVLTFGRASSFTNSDGVAWDFAKDKGYRAQFKGVPVVFESLLPSGTKAAYLNLSINVGWEHVISSKERFVVRNVSKFRNGYKVQGELV